MSEAPIKLESPPAKKPFLIENMDPSDFLPKVMLPNIMPEHVARYKFAKKYYPELANQEINILDIASGRGYGSDILKKEFPKATVIGVEFKGEYATKAHQKYGGKEESPNFLQADARRIPLKDSSMDVVTAFEIIEHLPKTDQASFMQEIARVLKPGGVAFISFPYRTSFETNKNNETVRSGPGSNPYHLYEPLPDEVEQYMVGSKLEVLGKFGQIMYSKRNANMMRKVNKIIPVWPFFAWGPKRDVSVTNVAEGKVSNTNIYVVKKPSSPNTT